MKKLLLNLRIINEKKSSQGHLLIHGAYIQKIFTAGEDYAAWITDDVEMIDLSGYCVIPGLIDTHVHFREPGLTHKGTIASESRAAVAGGVTSVLEMPNTKPPTLTNVQLQEKCRIAEANSFVNYGFFIGVSPENLNEILQKNYQRAFGIKLFMGSSTGNMLITDDDLLNRLFAEAHMPVMVHAEDENRILENIRQIKSQYGEDPPVSVHAKIRDEEACYQSAKKAVDLAKKHKTRLHLAHLSTQKELELLSNSPLEEKRITGEVCVSHLWFEEKDYERLGTLIKCNPAIKSLKNRNALRAAVNTDLIDVIATDHAPHTKDEKTQPYFLAPSGIPMVQHGLQVLLELVRQNVFSLETVVEKTVHNPAKLFAIKKRGFIREGYFADLVVIDLNARQIVHPSNIFYHCGWSPLEGMSFNSKIICTFVNGNLVFENLKHPKFKHYTPYPL